MQKLKKSCNPSLADTRDRYICVACGACCRWTGLVRLADDEIDRIAEHLGLNVREFIERFTRLASDRRGLVLTDRADGACVFLRGPNECMIYPVRPEQCRGFPNAWNFPGFRKECQCIDRFDLSNRETVSLDLRSQA